MSVADEPEQLRRLRFATATERHFEGKAWRPGKVDCGQLVAFHLRQIGWRLPQVAAYRSVEAGQARLAALGFATMADLIDGIGLRRRPAPAFSRVGDLVFGAGDGPLGALGIATGNGGFKGFHEEHRGLVGMRICSLITVAWDVMQ